MTCALGDHADTNGYPTPTIRRPGLLRRHGRLSALDDRLDRREKALCREGVTPLTQMDAVPMEQGLLRAVIEDVHKVTLGLTVP